MRFLRYLRFVIPVFTLFFLLSPEVFAACDRGLLLPACTCDGNCVLGDIIVLFLNLIQYALGLLGFISVFLFIHGGIRMIMARGIQEHISSARKQISGTVVGLVIVLLSWVLINGVFVALTGNSTGTVFDGGGTNIEKKWWTLDYTPECENPNFRCMEQNQSIDSSSCVPSQYCATGQKCCQ